VADIDAAFEQQIFNLPQRQRIANVHHHREADDLGGAVEVPKGIAHRRRLRIAPPELKPIALTSPPLALVDGRERIYFEHFWNDFAADPAHSVSESDRQLYAAASAQPGAMNRDLPSVPHPLAP
jgi:hypothetical protein